MKRILHATLLPLLVSAALTAQIPDRISWQGYLSDEGGPLNGPVDLVVRLYDAKAGGNELYMKDTTGVIATNGVVNVPLGSFGTPPAAPFNLFNGRRYLGIQVNGASELTPRTELASVPHAQSVRGMIPADDGTSLGTNISFGPNNVIADGVVGATISGGGGRAGNFLSPNEISQDFATIGGGFDNTAAGSKATVGGGSGNWARGEHATIGGGRANQSHGNNSAVGGGIGNDALGQASTVGGGTGNEAKGQYAAVPGGRQNRAAESYTFAAGRYASALHRGTFVWADSSGHSAGALESTGIDQFLIRAGGGVGINTNNPGSHDLRVVGSGPSGISTATLMVQNTSTDRGIAAVVETNGTDAAFIVGQNGTGDHIRTFDNGDLRFRVLDNGNVRADGTFIGGGADVAEALAVEGPRSAYAPGDVLVVSATRDRAVGLADAPYSRRIAGVFATRPGLVLTERGIEDELGDLVPMAVVGIVPTKVTNENGPIRRGDLLVSGSTPGHAMRGELDRLGFGMVIGKAMEAFDGEGAGVIEVLVNVK